LSTIFHCTQNMSMFHNKWNQRRWTHTHDQHACQHHKYISINDTAQTHLKNPRLLELQLVHHLSLHGEHEHVPQQAEPTALNTHTWPTRMPTLQIYKHKWDSTNPPKESTDAGAAACPPSFTAWRTWTCSTSIRINGTDHTHDRHAR